MKLIKVYLIAQERWYIRRQRCKCGSAYTRELQQALKGQMTDHPVDEIIMQCDGCGAIETFQFDISDCSPHLQFDWEEKVAAYAKVMPRKEAAALVLRTKMGCALDFIYELRDSRDALGLEFIADILSRAQNTVKETPPIEQGSAGSSKTV